MDKEDIEKMARLCCYPCEMCSGISGECIAGNDMGVCDIASHTAKRLINAGYGNIKQAVKEFAERAETIIDDMESIDDKEWAVGQIRELIKERFGEEK